MSLEFTTTTTVCVSQNIERHAKTIQPLMVKLYSLAASKYVHKIPVPGFPACFPTSVPTNILELKAGIDNYTLLSFRSFRVDNTELVDCLWDPKDPAAMPSLTAIYLIASYALDCEIPSDCLASFRRKEVYCKQTCEKVNRILKNCGCTLPPSIVKLKLLVEDILGVVTDWDTLIPDESIGPVV